MTGDFIYNRGATITSPMRGNVLASWIIEFKNDMRFCDQQFACHKLFDFISETIYSTLKRILRGTERP